MHSHPFACSISGLCLVVTNILVFTVKQAGYSRILLEALLNWISGIYHQVCWFASSLLPKSESTSPPSPEIQATLTACHPSSLASCIHGPLLPVCLPPCRQSELPNCQSDPASPLFKIPDELSLPLQLRQIPPGPAGPAVCLPLLLCPLHQLGALFQPWNVWCSPRSGLFWDCAFCSEFFSYLLVIYLFGCARS